MTPDTMRMAIVSAGYVGLAMAAGLTGQGRDVVLVERDPDRLAALVEGGTPFHEPAGASSALSLGMAMVGAGPAGQCLAGSSSPGVAG